MIKMKILMDLKENKVGMKLVMIMIIIIIIIIKKLAVKRLKL